MKIMFLIPPSSLETSYGRLKEFSNPQPSIGLAYIAAVLLKDSFEVSILDAYVDQLEVKKILLRIEEQRPEVIGISLLSTSVDVVTKLSELIRRKFPHIKIAMGNMHASLFSDKILKSRTADYIIHREGEYTFLELARALRDGKFVEHIKGLSYCKDGKTIDNSPRELIEKLDQLPYPAWNLFPLDRYGTDPRTEILPGEPGLQILATRGCPFSCTFCSSKTARSLGSEYRMRNPKKVADEIEYMYKNYGARVFSFMDLAFPLVKKHAMAILQEIIDRKLNKKIYWMTEARVRPIDYEILKKMKEAGCVRVNFGIESGNDRIILKILKKGFTTEDVRRAVKLAKKAGIQVDGMFMIGLPTETGKEIKQTIDFAVELNVRFAIFNIFVPYPGCELYDILTKEGKIRFKSWADFTSYPTYSGGKPVYVPDGLRHEELMGLQKYAMRKFYLRPRFFLNQITHFKPHQLSKYWNGLKGILFQR